MSAHLFFTPKKNFARVLLYHYYLYSLTCLSPGLLLPRALLMVSLRFTYYVEYSSVGCLSTRTTVFYNMFVLYPMYVMQVVVLVWPLGSLLYYCCCNIRSSRQLFQGRKSSRDYYNSVPPLLIVRVLTCYHPDCFFREHYLWYICTLPTTSSTIIVLDVSVPGLLSSTVRFYIIHHVPFRQDYFVEAASRLLQVMRDSGFMGMI